jgi:hypothetical protein
VTDYVLSIDCGVSTGIALLSYEEDSPAELVEGWQFGGGVVGLTKWVKEHWRESGWDGYNDEPQYAGLYHWKIGAPDWLTTETTPQYNYEAEEGEEFESELPPNLTVIAEKFTARNTRGFSYTTASLEPLRGEGALIALGLMPDYTVSEKRWRDPSLQYFSGGSGKAERKKRQHAFLKANGFYRTGKDFGTADADDYRSSAAHALSYIARELKHKPTFDMIAGNGEGTDE